MRPLLYSQAGAAGARYSDDASLVLLDTVTLTVTPASQANSLEGTGIRIDGRDQGVQAIPPGTLDPNFGILIFPWTPRHDDIEAIEFGNATPTIVQYFGNGANYFYLWFTAASNIRMTMLANAVGSNANWATGGAFFVPGVTHIFMIIYGPGNMWLYVDGVLRATITAATNFGVVAANAYYGSNNVGATQVDAVYG
jgi:hypothetical protein